MVINIHKYLQSFANAKEIFAEQSFLPIGELGANASLTIVSGFGNNKIRGGVSYRLDVVGFIELIKEYDCLQIVASRSHTNLNYNQVEWFKM